MMRCSPAECGGVLNNAIMHSYICVHRLSLLTTIDVCLLLRVFRRDLQSSTQDKERSMMDG